MAPSRAGACLYPTNLGSVFFMLRPSQGQPATSIAIRQRAKIEARPVWSFYLPVAFSLISFVLLLPSAISQPTTEARLTNSFLLWFRCLMFSCCCEFDGGHGKATPPPGRRSVPAQPHSPYRRDGMTERSLALAGRVGGRLRSQPDHGAHNGRPHDEEGGVLSHR